MFWLVTRSCLARFVVECDVNRVFVLSIDKFERSKFYTDVWYPVLPKKIQMKIQIFSEMTAFNKLLLVKFINLLIYLLLIAMLRAHVYMLQSYFFISFKVSVGWSEHHLCKFRKIIARRRLEKEIKVPDVSSLTEIRTRINGVAKVSYQQVYSWSLHEHKPYGPGWAATGKRVFQFISASKYSKRKIIMQRGW